MGRSVSASSATSGAGWPSASRVTVARRPALIRATKPSATARATAPYSSDWSLSITIPIGSGSGRGQRGLEARRHDDGGAHVSVGHRGGGGVDVVEGDEGDALHLGVDEPALELGGQLGAVLGHEPDLERRTRTRCRRRG